MTFLHARESLQCKHGASLPYFSEELAASDSCLCVVLYIYVCCEIIMHTTTLYNIYLFILLVL